MIKEPTGPPLEKTKKTTILRKKDGQEEIRKENGKEISTLESDTLALSEQEKKAIANKAIEKRLREDINGFLAQKYKKE